MTDLVIENGDLVVYVGSLTEVCFLVYMKSLQLETLFSDMLRHAACQVCVCFVSQLTGVCVCVCFRVTSAPVLPVCKGASETRR